MLLDLIRRGDAETRSGLPTNVRQWRTLLGLGVQTASGARVNEDSSLALGTVYACVKFLSMQLAALPVHVYRQSGRGRERVHDHPLDRILSVNANPRQTAFDAMQFLGASLFLRGNGVAFVQRDVSGRLLSIFPLRWDHLEPRLDDRGLSFVHTPPSGDASELLPGSYMFVHGLSLDGVLGLSPISAQRESVGYGLALQDYHSRFFSNSASPRGALTMEGSLGGGDPELAEAAITRLRTQFEALYSGTENAHRVAILEEGLKWEQIGINPKDADFLDSRKFNRSEIAGWFGIPPHLIGDLEKGSFSNVETQSLEFVLYHFLPWLRLVEQAIVRDLLTEEERDSGLFVRFVVEGLLRADSKSRAEFYTSGITAGWLSRNEVREKENLNPLPGGDDLLVPLNMARVDAATGEVIQPTPSGPAPSGVAGAALVRSSTPALEVRARSERTKIARSFVPLIEDVVGRIIRAEERRLEKILAATLPEARGAADPQLVAFLAAIEELHAEDGEFRGWIISKLRPNVRALGGAIFEASSGELETPPGSDGLADFLEGVAAAFAARYAIGSLRGLEAAAHARPDAPAAGVRALLEKWKAERPGRVAQKETVQQSRAAAREAFRRGGHTALRWRATGENCPFCQRLDGRIVAIDGGSFVNAGETFEAEGRSPITPPTFIGHPPLHRGCDCEIDPA